VREFWNGFQNFLGLGRSFQEDIRKADAEEYSRMARLRAMLIERYYLEQAASGDLGDAALGTLEDAAAADLLWPSGLYLGALDGRLLHLDADGHNLVYARAGGGKGVTSAQPICAGYTGSLFVNDLKDGELHFSTAEHREKNLGHQVITIDPWGIRTKNGAKVCPLYGLRKIVERGGLIDNEADEITLILLPRGKADAGENAWVRKAARRMLAMRMKHLAYSQPDRLSLSGLWRFVNCSDADLEVLFTEMTYSAHEDVAGPASAMMCLGGQRV